MSVFYGALGSDRPVGSMEKQIDLEWGQDAVRRFHLPAASFYAGIVQSASFFRLNFPIYNERKQRVYAVQGYLWGKAGFPLTQEDAAAALEEAGDCLLDNKSRFYQAVDGVFNLAVYDIPSTTLVIANDLSGLFPLYYHVSEKGFFWCSHQLMLAKALQLKADKIGVVQQTAFHYTIGRRSLFENVHRLNPGEVLIFHGNTGHLDVFHNPHIYHDIDRYSSITEAADAVWQDYAEGVSELAKPEGIRGVLLSGGFDTRLVVVGYANNGKEIAGVTFGDKGNYEAGIARRVAEMARADWANVDLSHDFDYSVQQISHAIKRVETVNFLYCQTGANALQQMGAQVGSTGYGGETLLGGQGYTLLGKSWDQKKRLATAVRRSLNCPVSFLTEMNADTFVAACDVVLAFHLRSLRQVVPLFTEEWRSSLQETQEILGDEINAELSRMNKSRPESVEQVYDRFNLEHHVLKQFGRQELTINETLPVVNPTVVSRFYQRCSNLDPSIKVDHGVYLELVKRHYGKFAGLPTSNIPLPLTYHPFFLWMARAARAYYDQECMKSQVKHKGNTRLRRAGWSNFEIWMRNGSFLGSVPGWVDDRIYAAPFLRARLDRVRTWDERIFSGQDFLTYISISQMVKDQV